MPLDSQTDLTLERRIEAPRALLWDCWTDPAHLKQFFVPRPHEVLECDMDPRVGGRFDVTFRIDGNIVPSKGVFLELVPQERLVFTDAYTEGWKPAPEPFMTAIVTFRDHPDGGTLLTVTARHRSAKARKTHEEMGFHDGWGVVAKQLEAHAKSL